MTEIEMYQPQNALSEKMEWSRAMAPSGLLPKQYRDNPANLLFAVEYADALNVDRIHAITSIHVIEGKPSASADLIAATVRRAGHKLRVMGDDSYAEAHLIRADDPEFTYSARWDLDKARAAGLLGKGVWKNYPGAMLRSRAITEVARMGASDALFGVQYTPEELGADSLDGSDLDRPRVVAAAPAADRLRAALNPDSSPAPDATTSESPAHADAPAAVEASAGEDSPPDVTEADVMLDPRSSLGKRMFATMNELGIKEKAERLDYCTAVTGREITSSSELTEGEAATIIDHLEAERAELPAAANTEPTQ